MEPSGPFKRMYPDDLAAADWADEERVVMTLGNRFSRGQYQTYAGGNILIIINPQKPTDLYDDEVISTAAADDDETLLLVLFFFMVTI